MGTERDKQREQLRNAPNGDPVPPYVASEPPGRPVPKCDPVIPAPPRVFVSPAGCPPPPAPEDLLPDALVFLSPRVEKDCSDVPTGGPVGATVVVAAGAFETNLYFQDLPDITTAQLSLIANQSQAVRTLIAAPSTPEAEIRRLLKLDAHQAAAFVTLRTAAIAEVLDLAETQAIGLLDCVWVNTTKTASCGADALETDDAPDTQAARVTNPSVVDAGTVSSTISQLDADAQALLQAQSALNCLWANTEQTANCVDDLGFSEAVPNDVNLTGEATRLRVGSVVIPAATVFSDVGQEDANNQAKALAVGQLACFYLNAALVVTCPADAENVAASISPEPSGIDASSGGAGNPVTVPAGYLESEVSTADANDQAAALGLSLLNCFWLNDEQPAVCEPQGPDGAYLPSPVSPTPRVTVAAGEVVSFTSKADANAQALLQAQLQLDCRYCSLVVPPRCIPLDYTVTVLPIPLSEVTDAWSLDATLGAPAGLFCSPDWESAQAAADSIANIPIPPAAPPGDCTYGNAPVEAQCIGDPGVSVIVPVVSNPRARGGPCFGGQTGSQSNPYILPLFEPADGVVRVALFDSVVGARLSSQSYPNPFAENLEARKVRVAQNAFTVTAGLVPAEYAPGNPDRARLYANELAAVLALSSLNCFFSNCAGYYLCHGQINAGSYNPPLTGSYLDVPIYGTGTAEVTVGTPAAYAVAPAAYGSTVNPVYVQEGQFVSYTSYDEVASGLNAFLRGTLDCYWTNPARTIRCGARLDTSLGVTEFVFNPGDGRVNGDLVHPRSLEAQGYGIDYSVGSTLTPVAVEAGLYFNYQHPKLADLQAIQLGLAQLDCFFVNDRIQVSCGSYGDFVKRVDSKLANGAVPSAVALPGTYSSKFSQANADTLARTAARTELLCLYKNNRVTGSKNCPAGQTASGPSEVPEGFVTSSVGTADANAQAANLLAAMQSCSPAPQAGNDGAQTGCGGNCYGYYS